MGPPPTRVEESMACDFWSTQNMVPSWGPERRKSMPMGASWLSTRRSGSWFGVSRDIDMMVPGTVFMLMMPLTVTRRKVEGTVWVCVGGKEG